MPVQTTSLCCKAAAQVPVVAGAAACWVGVLCPCWSWAALCQSPACLAHVFMPAVGYAWCHWLTACCVVAVHPLPLPPPLPLPLLCCVPGDDMALHSQNCSRSSRRKPCSSPSSSCSRSRSRSRSPGRSRGLSAASSCEHDHHQQQRRRSGCSYSSDWDMPDSCGDDARERRSSSKGGRDGPRGNSAARLQAPRRRNSSGAPLPVPRGGDREQQHAGRQLGDSWGRAQGQEGGRGDGNCGGSTCSSGSSGLVGQGPQRSPQRSRGGDRPSAAAGSSRDGYRGGTEGRREGWDHGGNGMHRPGQGYGGSREDHQPHSNSSRQPSAGREVSQGAAGGNQARSHSSSKGGRKKDRDYWTQQGEAHPDSSRGRTEHVYSTTSGRRQAPSGPAAAAAAAATATAAARAQAISGCLMTSARRTPPALAAAAMARSSAESSWSSRHQAALASLAARATAGTMGSRALGPSRVTQGTSLRTLLPSCLPRCQVRRAC